MSLSEQILQGLAAVQKPREALPASEWPWSKEPLYVYGVSPKEWDEISQLTVKRDHRTGKTRVNMNNVRARFAVRMIRDGQGNRVFTDGQAEELGKAATAIILDRVWDIGHRLNQATEEEAEEAEKNLPTPTANGAPKCAPPSPSVART